MAVYDVVTLGETMLRLTPPAMQRIEQTQTFEMHVGGSESNTAVGLARLGMKVCWLSRLTDNALGHTISGTIARFGVDTSHIVWTDEDRVGLYFYEPSPPPRSSSIIYDRAASALSKMQPDDLPADLFTAQGARLLHLTGITPATGAVDVTLRAMQLAQAAGWQISFDMNYRRKLWDADAARDGCEPFMQAANVIFISLDDVHTIYGGISDAMDALRMLGARYPQATLVLTLGAKGAAARTVDGAVIEQPTFPAGELGRIGGGDAFSAGFLYGYLNESGADHIALALRWGAACAALKYSIAGDLPLFEYAEVLTLVQQGAVRNTIQR
jgi:2-dehydro-3-deoxygluconokinase